MRLVPGRSGWWCIAPSGTALLPAGWVTGGALARHARAALELTGITEPKPVTAYALTVLTSTRCNLGCPYCFQNTGTAAPGRFDPPRIAAATLRPRTVRSIATFTRDRMAAAGLSKLHVLLFGGEPLANPRGCTELLARLGEIAELSAFSAAMVSNGTLLDAPLAAQLEVLGLRSVQITLDGPQWIHDTLRVTRSGRGTFDRILDNVAVAQQATDLRVDLRINLTPAVLPYLAELIGQVAGRLCATRCRLGIAPVGEVPPEAAEQVVAAYAVARAAGFRIPRPTDGRCAYCAEPDGRTGAVVNADGILYSCWESAGRPGFEVGDVESGYRAYPAGRWVRCTKASQRFVDAVDAGLLDLLWEERRDRQWARS